MEIYRLKAEHEKIELDKKIKALSTFLSSKISNEIPEMERYLLVKQLLPMKEYSSILEERVRLFNSQKGHEAS